MAFSFISAPAIDAVSVLVEVPVVGPMKMPVVGVVDVIAVRDGDVAAALPVYVGVPGVFGVCSGHVRLLSSNCSAIAHISSCA